MMINGLWAEYKGYVFAVVCIAASTGIFMLGREYFAKGQWALLYILIIGLVAGISGVRPALLAAVLAFFSWNYFFLPPFHAFVVSDPKDWISLFVFLIVGIAVGTQTGRMRESKEEAISREREMALLNEFSAHLVSDKSIPDMTDLLVRDVKRTTGASCVALFLPNKSGRLERVVSPSNVCEPPSYVFDAAEWSYKESKAIGLINPSTRSEINQEGWPVSASANSIAIPVKRDEVFIPFQTVSRQEGVLYVGQRSDGKPYSLRDARLLVAVANQSAAFLERKYLQSVAVKADALQEADKLKSTFISSVSHELKTPLASLTATVSNLLELDIKWDEAHIRNELEAIQDDLQRLNKSIGALLDLSRLEASAWEPRREFYEFGEILGVAISMLPQKQHWRISYDIPDDLPMIKVDFHQWTRAVQNLLENALSYSPENSPVRIGACHTQLEVRMWVEDEGPGIPPEDRERVFEKFYRGETSGRVPSGTGLGFAVTREIVKYQGGKIWIEDTVPHGTKMVLSLPKEDS